MSPTAARSVWKMLIRSGFDSSSENWNKINGLNVHKFGNTLINVGACKYKGTLARRPVRVYDPLEKLSKPNINSKPLEELKIQTGGGSNSSISASVFNLTMGEVMMSNSNKQIAVEGVRLVEEAIKAGLQMDKLFILKSLKELSPGLNHLLDGESKTVSTRKSDGPEIHRVSLTLMQTWSSVTTPPGIIGIFKKPQPRDISISKLEDRINFPLTVICDNIREPGNLGSILRSAAAAGCGQVILTKGCVDPWNMKVLRGACGAHYNIQILSDVDDSLLESLLIEKSVQEDTNKSRVALILSDNNIEDARTKLPSVSHWNVDFSSFQHVFIVIGGETSGIGSNILRMIKSFNENHPVVPIRLRIPLANNIESLNAANAFGIIAFEIIRQLSTDKRVV